MSIHLSGSSRPGLVGLTIASVFALSGVSLGWSVSGTVKTSSGTALAGVAVTVKDSSSYSATTDASGAFTLGSTTGILSRERSSDGLAAQVSGAELLVRGSTDATVELSLVDVSGRLLWHARSATASGEARVAMPIGLNAGAAYLRVRDSRNESIQAVLVGSEGLKSTSRLVARALATTYQTLVFKKSGYNDTSYAMTAASQTAIAVVMSATTTCAFPTTFKWKDYGSAVASAVGNNWVAIKDFTNVTMSDGRHLIYSSTHDQSNYGSEGMAPFTNWSDAASATQTKMTTSTVAPEVMYLSTKNTWILSYQWCAAKFCYMTSSDPTKPNGWTGSKALLSEDITSSSTGPIDQVPICDSTKCYLFYAGDNGHIYRASMAKSSFPGTFTGSTSILQDTQANLFEAVEVYTVKGTGKYLMIVECMGSGGRYFRAFSATSLGGAWTSISGANNESTPFAGKKNVTFTGTAWTNDISHGDLVRSYDETRTVDPCNLQMLYQGYDPSSTASYGHLPYKLGLLTFTGK
jgi:hypothetical protein